MNVTLVAAFSAELLFRIPPCVLPLIPTGQTGQRIAGANVRFEHGVPVFPRRPGAPTLSVEDVDRLADGASE